MNNYELNGKMFLEQFATRCDWFQVDWTKFEGDTAFTVKCNLAAERRDVKVKLKRKCATCLTMRPTETESLARVQSAPAPEHVI